jgi:peptidoglycan/LPS O-acetylase OafA/YrhL
MGTTLSAHTNSRDNNFNLIRFVAATLVLYTHSYALVFGTGDAEPMRSFLGMTWGGISVDVFFVTSGFLIAGSYFSRKSLLFFVWARVLRIYPALIVAIFLCVFVVGLYFTVLPEKEYLTSLQTVKFFIKNTILIFGVEYYLPGVFEELPWKYAVNGSLWTLPIEVKMYAILAAFVVFWSFFNSRFPVKYVFLIVSCLSVLINLLNHFYSFLPIKFLHLFSMFFVGAACYVWKDRINLDSSVFFVGISLLLLSSFFKDVFFIFYVFSIPYAIFFLAYAESGFLRRFNRLGDYSYGLYIYAFPVQQSLVALMPNISVFNMVVISFVVTLFLSVLSWHLIEKRFLMLKDSYVFLEVWVKNMLCKLRLK